MTTASQKMHRDPLAINHWWMIPHSDPNGRNMNRTALPFPVPALITAGPPVRSRAGGSQRVLESARAKLLAIQVPVPPGWPDHMHSGRPGDRSRGPERPATRSVLVEKDDRRVALLLLLSVRSRAVSRRATAGARDPEGARPDR